MKYNSLLLSKKKTHDVVSFDVPTTPCAIATASSSYTRSRVREDNKSHLTCSYYKKSGHEMSSCFEIHGYPSWGEEHKAATASCGGWRTTGTPTARVREPVRANATIVDTAEAPGVVIGATATPSSLFTVDQWKALEGLLGNNKIFDDRLHGIFSTTDWIVDAGASDHVTRDASLLFDTICIPSCPMGLPNGAIVMAK